MLIEKAKELAAKKGYLGIYTQARTIIFLPAFFISTTVFRIGGLDTEIYNGTNQEGKADILFYLDLLPRGGFVPPVAAVEKDPARKNRAGSFFNLCISSVYPNPFLPRTKTAGKTRQLSSYITPYHNKQSTIGRKMAGR